MTTDTHDRVKADLTTHELAMRDMGWEEFNPHDDALIHDIVAAGKMRGPIQELLILCDQIALAQGSFGIDHAALGKSVLPMLIKLRAAAVAEWQDL
jgi:hypothetical protein